MELGVLERIALLQLLPPSEGSYVTYKILQDLKTSLGFNEDELKELNLIQNQEEKTVTWDVTKEFKKEISIGDKAKSIIVEALNKLDAEGKINQNNVSLYEKFVVDNV
jgi:hypothetical protein